MAKSKKPDKRNMTRLLALILCILLAGTAVVGALVSIAYAQEEPGNQTEIRLTVEEGAQGLRAFQITRYVNRTGRRLEQVIFALGANTLRRLSTAPFEDGQLAQAYPQGFNVGGVQMDNVLVNGQQADWGVQGQGESFLRVACDAAPGEEIQFEFEYQVLLPQAQGFLGVGDMGWRLSFFSPAPCVYEDGDFACVDLRAVGDSAYFEPQEFEVTVDAPDTYLVASGGRTETAPGEEGRLVTTITMENASSLALALGRRYTRYQGESQGVALDCYANTASGARRALDAAEKVLSAYVQGLGGCPVEKVTIVQVDGVKEVEAHDGLLLVDKELFSGGQGDALERALALGLAKQWFGLSVRNSPEKAPWLSEAVSAYLSLLYYETQYGHQRFLQELNGQVLDALNITLAGRLTPDAQRSQFSSQYTYGIIVTQRGAAVLHEIRSLVDAQGMWAIFSQYYQQRKGLTADISDFEDAMAQATGRDLSQALESHMLTISEYVQQQVEWLE